MRWLLLLILAACDRPRIDREGCWTDPEQAYWATVDQGCQLSDVCYEEDSGWSGEIPSQEQCEAQAADSLPSIRQTTCFDGCAVPACLAALEAYSKDCTTDTSVCYLEAFFEYNSSDKPCEAPGW